MKKVVSFFAKVGKSIRLFLRGKVCKKLIPWCALFLGICLFGCACFLAIGASMCNKTAPRITTAEELTAAGEHFDVILVLGCAVRKDGTPSHMLEDRIKVAVDVYNATGADYILMSGDRSGEYYDEPAAMRKYAESLGVDPSRILIDECGFSTYESMERADELFDFDKVIVITQKYHLHRALYIANTKEYEAVGVSSNLRPYSGQLIREFREILARVKDFFMCL